MKALDMNYIKELLKVKEGNFSDSYLTSNTVTCTKNNTNHIVLLTNENISTSKDIIYIIHMDRWC